MGELSAGELSLGELSCNLFKIYVDDILIASQSLADTQNIKSKVSSRFGMKDLGPLHHFLGVKFVQDFQHNTIGLVQSTFIECLLRKFSMHDFKPVRTPCDVSISLVSTSEGDEFHDKTEYQTAVRGLLYLSTKTRPDITSEIHRAARSTVSDCAWGGGGNCPPNPLLNKIQSIYRPPPAMTLLGSF